MQSFVELKGAQALLQLSPVHFFLLTELRVRGGCVARQWGRRLVPTVEVCLAEATRARVQELLAQHGVDMR